MKAVIAPIGGGDHRAPPLCGRRVRRSSVTNWDKHHRRAKPCSIALSSTLLIGAIAVVQPVLGAWPSARAQPVVVELFQSQGCSSCLPANAKLNAIADRPGVLALSFAVTYWDNLGWNDTFAKKEFTARQWDYARGLGRDNVGTPQVVINGRHDLVGANRVSFDAAIKSAPPLRGPRISFIGDKVLIGGSPERLSADVWLVRYHPRTEQVPIRRGENGGKTLPHKNIAKALERLGSWWAAAASYRMPPAKDSALRTAILLQTPAGGLLYTAATK